MKTYTGPSTSFVTELVYFTRLYFLTLLSEKLPDVDDVLGYITVCGNDGTSCTQNKNLEVIKCGENDFMFNIQRLPGCNQAYCIGKHLVGRLIDIAFKYPYKTVFLSAFIITITITSCVVVDD